MTSISAPKIRRMRGWATVLTLHSYHWSHGEDREDRRRVARGAHAGAVQGAPREGRGAPVHPRARTHVRAGHLSVRRLRGEAVRVGREVRLGLWLAGVLRAGERRGDRRG